MDPSVSLGEQKGSPGRRVQGYSAGKHTCQGQFGPHRYDIKVCPFENLYRIFFTLFPPASCPFRQRTLLFKKHQCKWYAYHRKQQLIVSQSTDSQAANFFRSYANCYPLILNFCQSANHQSPSFIANELLFLQHFSQSALYWGDGGRKMGKGKERGDGQSYSAKCISTLDPLIFTSPLRSWAISGTY